MENLYSRIRQSKIAGKLPSKKELNKAFSSFSKIELRVFGVLLAILILTTVLMLNNINQSLMTSVPMRGSSISEGVIGTPRFINPVLAFSDADQDMVSLVYSGLLRKIYISMTRGLSLPMMSSLL